MASRHDRPSQSSKRAVGKSIGQFVIDKDIGKGSFAQVYMGWHKVRSKDDPDVLWPWSMDPSLFSLRTEHGGVAAFEHAPPVLPASAPSGIVLVSSADTVTSAGKQGGRRNQVRRARPS